ncbi:MAG: putative Ig domain-containing protein [Myxococcaceae bacterium]|nr:putative Ig domain-containing protein [Myxococcaceae bacterium]
MRAFAVLAAVVAVDAWAQTNYVVTSTPQPYVPLTGSGVVTITPMMTGGGIFPVRDEGYYDLPLGFTFPFFGNTYTNVGINSNGLLLFGPTANAACNYSNGSSTNCNSPSPIPSQSHTPHNMIAPWWDDHEGNATGDIRYFQPSPSEMVIEFWDWNNYFNFGASFSFQVRLNASGLIQVHYGPKSGSFSGVTGLEDSTGSQGVAFLPCTWCTNADWPTDTLVTIGQPVQPDLMVQAVNLVSTVKTGNDLDITVSPTFRNIGQNDAINFHWKAYLSADKLLDPATDPLFYDSAVANAPVTVLGVNNTTNPTATATGSGTVTNVANGNYYVLVEADTTNVVAEFSETNNLGATATYFTFGIDLVANSISGPSQTGPGNSETLHLDWFNQGTDPAPAPVEFRAILSTDKNYDPATDFVVETWTETVNGGTTCSGSTCTHTVEIPSNVPGGDYYFGLVIDPNGQVTESKTNNVAFAATQTKVFQADLEAISADLIDPVTLQPVRMGFFGENATATVVIKNGGGADAKNFSVAVVISRDGNLSLLNDTIILDQPVTIIPAGQTQTVTINFQFPTEDKDGHPFTPDSYFLFVIADSYSTVTELSENNNVRAVGKNGVVEPVQLRMPAPDYTVTGTDVPAVAAVGEVVPVYRVIRNVGNADGATVSYRYFASANEIISTEDLALPIIGPTGEVEEAGEVTLAAGQADSGTDLVRIPAALPAGTWFIGCVVDAANAEPEISETNNAGYASDAMQIAPSAMSISTQQLPDATVDMPYAFKLGVSGAQVPVTWEVEGTLPTGLQLNPATGVVSGTPTATSISSFTVYATNERQAAAARLVMRVLPSSGELNVTTTALPPVINSPTHEYAANFAAAGGTRPYTWKLLSGTIPDGLTLEADGSLHGHVMQDGMEGEYPLLVEVADSLGNRARAEVKLRVVQPGALLITSVVVPEVAVGSDYIADFAAQSADGSALATPLTWTVVSGRLPEGLAFTVVQQELGLLTGKPHEAGVFPFSLQVMDAKGRSDVADFVLRVHPSRLKLSAVNPPAELHPGDQVNFQITTGSTDSRYRLFSGALPPGLNIDEAGAVTGTVGQENTVGTWNFVVEAHSAIAGDSLGAFTLEVKPLPEKVGCSAAGGSSFGMFTLLAPLGLLLMRRRRTAGAVAAVAALALVMAPRAAHAQAQPYTVVGPATAPYVPLSGGTTLNVAPYTGVQVTIPFDFEFYGTVYTDVGVSMNGYIAFQGPLDATYQYGIPHNYTYLPNVGVAAWWTALDFSPTGSVKSEVIGTAPNRELVIEWKDVECVYWTCSTGGKFSFQIHLIEGSNRIRIAYGSQLPPTGSEAAVGIMGGPNVGLAGLPCTSSTGGYCDSTDFPSGAVLDFALPPDLQIDSWAADDIGYSGVLFPASAWISNRGGLNAQGASVRFYLSEDVVFDPGTDLQVGDSNVVSVPVVGRALVTAQLQFPSTVEPGAYFLFAEVDPTNAVAEGLKEGNNLAVPRLFTVGTPTPDLQPFAVQGPSSAQGGGTLTITPEIRNAGNADSTDPVTVTYFVSDNSVVTVSDFAVGTDQVPPLAFGGTSFNTPKQITLPGNLSAGRYWVGVCVDYDPTATPHSTLTEISEVNNCLTGNSFILDTGALAVVTTTLPMATQNAAFGLRLEATGGDGSYVWSVASGELPPGVALGPDGELRGTPSEAGDFSFTVKVASAGGEATQALTLNVQPKNLPFAIVDQTLPPAEFGRRYEVQLTAVGGKPPYTWALKEGTKLPEGLGLSADGFIEGRAARADDEAVAFSVTATDQEGTVSARDLEIAVVLPESMHIATSRLPDAVLGRGYKVELEAVGGEPPYKWTPVRFQQLALNATETPSQEASTIPDGFGLKVISAGNGAQLTGRPNLSGLFTITFLVQDNAGAEDITTLPLRVRYEDALQVTTTVLPDAFVGQTYTARLSHNFDSDDGVTFSTACVEQAQSTAEGFSFSCVSADPLQQLPPGLTLAADGTISGAPTGLPDSVTSPGVDQNGQPLPRSVVYSFLVKAKDPQGRSDVRSLSIKVRELPPEKSGCSGTGVGPVALALLAVAGWMARGRRRAC